MELYKTANEFLVDQYAKGIEFVKQYGTSRTLDLWEGTTLPRFFRAIATLGVAAAIAYPAIHLRSTLSTPQLALTIGGALALAPRLGSRIAAGAITIFRKVFKPSYVARQIEKIKELSKSNSKSALILQTSHDPNEAFTTHQFVDSFKRWAAKHSIDIIKENSRIAIAKAMQLKIDSKKKYDVIVFSGHSTADGIRLAENMFLSKSYEAFDGFMKAIESHLKESGSIIINGCSAGSGENNIAREISCKLPHATVYASSDKVSALSIDYDDDMTPCFYNYASWDFNTPKKDTTRIYRNGELIVKPPAEHLNTCEFKGVRTASN